MRPVSHPVNVAWSNHCTARWSRGLISRS